MRTLLSYLLLVMLSVVAQAQQVQRIEITKVGIYHAKITGRTAAPTTPIGRVDALSDVRFIQETTTIPAKLGTNFGFRYIPIGQPSGATVKLTIVSHYPSPGLRNPATGNTNIRGEYSEQKKLSTETLQGYGFEEDWELVPGTWTFEIWQDDRKLAEQSFTVVKP